ncbi:MAG: tRNA (adenosine(37)-N6)-threonylcarbamoyltransferase complex dimerization subunit type 1 TsaB [Candidatus Omnitrophota bacterium]
MEKNTLILSADTSSSRFSIALIERGLLIDELEAASINRHSSDLLPSIDKMLSKNSYRLDDITAFCVGLGPGSFTGLRVGVTTMRGLALSLSKPIIGIASIDCIAYSALGYKGKICAILDARQEKVYACIYHSSGKRIVPESKILLIGPKDLLKLRQIAGPTIFLGDGLKLYKDDILKERGRMADFAPESLWYPKAAIAGVLGLDRINRRSYDNVYSLSPLYIYPKECQVRKSL